VLSQLEEALSEVAPNGYAALSAEYNQGIPSPPTPTRTVRSLLIRRGGRWVSLSMVFSICLYLHISSRVSIGCLD